MTVNRAAQVRDFSPGLAAPVILGRAHGGGWIIGFETGGFVRALSCRMRCDGGDSRAGDAHSLASDAVSICEVLELAGVNVFIGVLSSLWAPERSRLNGAVETFGWSQQC